MDTIFSSFTASFLIEALGQDGLGGALIVPAGWQFRAIEPLCEPSIHQSGKMLNPPERTQPLLPISSLSLSPSTPSVSSSWCVFILHSQT